MKKTLGVTGRPLSLEDSKKLERVLTGLCDMRKEWEQEARLHQAQALESAKKIILR